MNLNYSMMDTAILSPIILFLYNRLGHTKEIVEALQRNDLAAESDLYIFCDGPKENATQKQIAEIVEVQLYAEQISGFKNVYVKKQKINRGLANSVINGVSEVIREYGKAIIVEDDIITHPFFLRFMNEALSYYEDEKRIFTIGGMTDKIDIPLSYKKDIFVSQRVESWGWATWADRWFSAEWDISKYSIFEKNPKKEISKLCRGGEDLWPMLQLQAQNKIDSWAVRWQYNMSMQNKYCLRPIQSFVINVGMDGTGVHCDASETGRAPSTPLYSNNYYKIGLEHNIKENKKISINNRRYYARPQMPIAIKLKVFVYEVLIKIRKILFVRK